MQPNTAGQGEAINTLFKLPPPTKPLKETKSVTKFESTEASRAATIAFIERRADRYMDDIRVILEAPERDGFKIEITNNPRTGEYRYFVFQRGEYTEDEGWGGLELYATGRAERFIAAYDNANSIRKVAYTKSLKTEKIVWDHIKLASAT